MNIYNKMTQNYDELLSYLTPLAPYLTKRGYFKGQRGGADVLNASSIISLLLSLYAAYLAWECSRFETPIMRFLYTVIAFLLGGLYLIYYFVYRYLMGNRCHFAL